MKTIELHLNHKYKLSPLAPIDRKDGVIYLSNSRVFELLQIFSDGSGTVSCTDTGKLFNVALNRLVNF